MVVVVVAVLTTTHTCYNVQADDLTELEVQFANLCEFKDDSQQRNWAIQDDDDVIIGLISNITSLLVS